MSWPDKFLWTLNLCFISEKEWITKKCLRKNDRGSKSWWRSELCFGIRLGVQTTAFICSGACSSCYIHGKKCCLNYYLIGFLYFAYCFLPLVGWVVNQWNSAFQTQKKKTIWLIFNSLLLHYFKWNNYLVIFYNFI